MSQVTTTPPPRTYDFQSDSAGNWSTQVTNGLSPGPHVVTVQDEKGNIDQAIMYVIKEGAAAQSTVKTEAVVVDRVIHAVPEYFFWPIIILACATLITASLLVRLARRATKSEKQISEGSAFPAQFKPHHYLPQAVIVFSTALIVVICVGIWLNRQTNFLSGYFVKPAQLVTVAEVSGQVLDPLSKTGVGNIDLVVGNTSIKTSDSGHYIFNNIATKDGIRATYSDLLRPLVFLPVGKEAKERLDIFFNTEMHNLLIRVLDAEAKGQFSDIYDKYASPDVKSRATIGAFEKNYATILTPANIADQELVVKSVNILDNFKVQKYNLQLDKAIVIKVLVNGADVEYVLQNVGGKWYLIK